jgi:hypothetical protein
MEVLDVYIDVVRADGAEAAERRFPGGKNPAVGDAHPVSGSVTGLRSEER